MHYAFIPNVDTTHLLAESQVNLAIIFKRSKLIPIIIFTLKYICYQSLWDIDFPPKMSIKENFTSKDPKH